MKTFMAATLLATTFAAQAVTNRDLKVVCGSQEEMAATLEVYQEIPYYDINNHLCVIHNKNPGKCNC